MAQKFYADPATAQRHPNGATAYAPGGSFDALGHWAKVKQCPIVSEGLSGLALTCYATGYHDTACTVPACTRYKGHHIGGHFTMTGAGPVFRVSLRYRERLLSLHRQEGTQAVQPLAEWRKQRQGASA